MEQGKIAFTAVYLKGNHGYVGFIFGGIKANRKMFGTMLPGVDHLPHTHDLARNAFGGLQVDVAQHDVGPALCQILRDRLTQARCASRDQRHPAVE